jgi:peroxiredoxin
MLLLVSGLAHADLTLELDDGADLPIATYPAEGDRLLLWMPSEFGISPRQKPTAEALAKLGIEVWMPDLHSAWFIPPGRYSLNDVDPQALVKLIERALGTGKRLYLFASGRLTALSLQAIRRYQLGDGPTAKIGGLIAISPRLYLRTPQGGEAAEYLPIASASNVPIYLLQPREASGFWRIGQVAERLRRGGSPVFIQLLDGVGDAFNLRDQFTDTEAAMTRRLPKILEQAMWQLAAYPGAPAKAAPMHGKETAPKGAEGSALLRPYPGKRQAPPLQLDTLDGRRIDLHGLRGKVVMVNFWATWCHPCVKEIPSLQRLYRASRDQGLEIVAVAVGEPEAKVRKFLADKPVEFPVLLDEHGTALKTWGVHAFPTTLVLDRSQHIRYAVFGAFDWNSDEVHRTLKPLLAEPAK